MNITHGIFRGRNIAFLFIVLIALYLSSLYSYLLFHSLAELFSIVVACGIFMVAWNSRRFMDNNYFLFLGIAYLFTAGIEVIHTLSYKGMGVFPGFDANLPTQLWIAVRYMQGLSLLIAPLFLRLRFNPWPAFAAYAAVTILMLGSIFYWKSFPDCYVEGVGLTAFKKTSEYVISFVFLGAFGVLYRYRARLDRAVFRLLAASIFVGVGAELAFTFFIGAYGFSNLVGHYLKIISYYLIYKALIETGLKKPYTLLFRDLKQSEEKYQSLFANMTNGFAYHKVLVDEYNQPIDYVIVEINDAFERLTGLKRKLVIGKRITEVLPGIEKDDFDWIGKYGRVALRGEEARFERYSKEVGRWYSVSAYSPERGYFVTVFQDITERKRAEKLLKLNEARLEALQELSHMTDVSMDEMSDFVLEQAVRLTGSNAALLGSVSEGEKIFTVHAWSRHVMEECEVADKQIHFPLDQAGIWAEAIRQRKPVIISDYSAPNELKRGLPEGHVKLTNLLSVPVLDGNDVVAVAAVGNKDGEYDSSDINQLVLLMNGMWRYVQRKRVEEELGEYRKRLEEIVEERTQDLMRTNEELEAEIAAHKEALQALQESEKKFENLAETAPIGIIITNPAGRVMEANSSLLTLFGYSSKEELLAVPVTHHYVEPSEREQFLELMKSGTVRDFEVQLKRKDGSWFWASAASVTQSTGIDTYFITTIQDITERKKLEEELIRTQKLESLGVLAGGIAHDFNNALTAILNNITVARMSATPGDKVSKLLSAAERASLSARNLTRQLLTFSKGGDPVRKSIVLEDFLEETTRFALTGSKVTSEFTIAEDLWPVEADEGQLTQVMNNLVLNAAQAMPEGGTITVGAENVTILKDSAMQLKEGRYVKLTVRDQGPGIPAENLHRIFDPYFTTKEDGTGLGLAISYSIVKKHGGRLGVESETGNGAVFSVYLPTSDEIHVERGDREEAPPKHKGRLLLLEDDELIAESLAMALSEFGYKTEHTQDGREAALLYRKAHESGAPFDLVIMDLTVPGGLGGRNTLKLLREINPDVRAIATSGYSNDPVMSNYEEYGFSGIITKPYLVEELIDILKISSP